MFDSSTVKSQGVSQPLCQDCTARPPPLAQVVDGDGTAPGPRRLQQAWEHWCRRAAAFAPLRHLTLVRAIPGDPPHKCTAALSTLGPAARVRPAPRGWPCSTQVRERGAECSFLQGCPSGPCPWYACTCLKVTCWPGNVSALVPLSS